MDNSIKHYWLSDKFIYTLIYKLYQWVKENNAKVDIVAIRIEKIRNKWTAGIHYTEW